MAQVDYFLKINGIEGESTDAKHKNEIDVESWSWGETNSGTHASGGGGGAGKVYMGDFTFTMKVNKASPKLFLACATGQHIPDATLTCRKAGGEQQEYLTIKMSDLLISSFETVGTKGDVVPIDAICVNFSKIEYEYKIQDAKGKTSLAAKVGYDLKLNKKV
jgi:type VI secretion system secreted protein Hcp